jgi:hypothetical protein
MLVALGSCTSACARAFRCICFRAPRLDAPALLNIDKLAFVVIDHMTVVTVQTGAAPRILPGGKTTASASGQHKPRQ